MSEPPASAGGKFDMEPSTQALETFGKRIQRCYGCFIAYHLKDMYLGEDVTFFCEYCKDASMFHFDEFSKLLDLSKLNEVTGQQH
jgi:hypothetical protein